MSTAEPALRAALRHARELLRYTNSLPRGRRLRHLWATLRRSWRRSLQLRVVTLTLVLSGLLVAMFGWVVVSMITNGLISAKVQTATKQVRFGAGYADGQLQGITRSNDPALLSTVPAIVAQLGTTNDPGGPIDVVMLSRDDAGSDGLAGLSPQALAWPDRDAYTVVRSAE